MYINVGITTCFVSASSRYGPEVLAYTPVSLFFSTFVCTFCLATKDMKKARFLAVVDSTGNTHVEPTEGVRDDSDMKENTKAKVRSGSLQILFPSYSAVDDGSILQRIQTQNEPSVGFMQVRNFGRICPGNGPKKKPAHHTYVFLIRWLFRSIPFFFSGSRRKIRSNHV
jgi:hypothetical protein